MGGPEPVRVALAPRHRVADFGFDASPLNLKEIITHVRGDSDNSYSLAHSAHNTYKDDPSLSHLVTGTQLMSFKVGHRKTCMTIEVSVSERAALPASARYATTQPC